MADKIEITIRNRSRLLRNLATAAALMMMVVTPITIGIIVNSDAMQWVGFILGSLAVIGFANQVNKNNTVHSFAEARALLDKMESEQK